jgi:hypothetical protein
MACSRWGTISSLLTPITTRGTSPAAARAPTSAPPSIGDLNLGEAVPVTAATFGQGGVSGLSILESTQSMVRAGTWTIGIIRVLVSAIEDEALQGDTHTCATSADAGVTSFAATGLWIGPGDSR